MILVSAWLPLPAFLKKYDVSSLKHLFLAGEPLDEPTHVWISEALGIPVIDHYWQTETGWPILSAVPGVEKTPIKFGSSQFCFLLKSFYTFCIA